MMDELDGQAVMDKLVIDKLWIDKLVMGHP
jgi:hypothetical protein